VSAPVPLHCPLLERNGISHAFFTRDGGVSQGVYASLNGGVGSSDAPAAVSENRRRMAQQLGVRADRLLIPYQTHSAEALVVTTAWEEAQRPRCDALVTNAPGLAIGVTGADCGMILLHDPGSGVIGAAHAGWKGALGGVLEAVVAQMESLGASRACILAALGPTIARASYEVGPEFVEKFLQKDAESGRFFAQAPSGRDCFDLPAYIGERLRRAGVSRFEDLDLDTYGDEQRFFSYRRSVHRSEADYGRMVGAIALT